MSRNDKIIALAKVIAAKDFIAREMRNDAGRMVSVPGGLVESFGCSTPDELLSKASSLDDDLCQLCTDMVLLCKGIE